MSKRMILQKLALPLTVFFTGACILIIEVVATRMLAPYFGNTIYSFSSIISIILAALSVGYYFGGRLADKRPDPKLFYAIILAGGLAVLLMYLLYYFFVPYIGRSLPISSGALVASALLFFLPGFLLGTLSPFAIKLQEQRFPKEGIGTIAGEMFFWSTMGSIFGSLAAGFVLIPWLGVDLIVQSVGYVLILFGVWKLVRLRTNPKNLFKIGAVVLLLASFELGILVQPVQAVYSKDGVYEKLTIKDMPYYGQQARFLLQDRSNSGAMYLHSDVPLFDYTKYWHLYPEFDTNIQEALVLGGGAYSIPKDILRTLPQASVDVAEIEPGLFDLAKKYLNTPESPRLKNYVEDGRRLMQDSHKKYDLIFGDVYYSLYSVPGHFTTREFFELTRSRLNDKGLFIANFIGDLTDQQPSLTLAEIKTFKETFPNSYFIATQSDRGGPQNLLFIGYKSDQKIDLSKSNLLDLNGKLVDTTTFDLTKHPTLTDNYAPVEYLNTTLINKIKY